MIVIVDYGVGNAASIMNMIRKADGNAIISSDIEQINSASAIVLPGVGAFDSGIVKLKQSGLIDVVQSRVLQDKIPFLGICLGMQLIFEKSEEGQMPGLGWLKGEVKKFNFSDVSLDKPLKIPHMGWNVIRPVNFETLYMNMEQQARFYFVHSYHVVCEDKSDILAKATYGYDFTCSVNHENIWGVQFHPEKSHRFGVQFFKNFLKIIEHA